MFKMAWYFGVREVHAPGVRLKPTFEPVKQPFPPIQSLLSLHQSNRKWAYYGFQTAKRILCCYPQIVVPLLPKGHPKVCPKGKRRGQKQGAASFPAMSRNAIKTPFMESKWSLSTASEETASAWKPISVKWKGLFPKERVHNGLKIKHLFSYHKVSWVKMA